MKTGTEGYALIKHFETLRLHAYDDATGAPVPAGGHAEGILTNGYGHTGKDVYPGQACTEQQADHWLAGDVAQAEAVVNRAVRAPLAQHQFDALVSFVFNVGPGVRGIKDGFLVLRNGNPSTLLRRLNAQDHAAAAAQISLWVRAAGHEVPGLIVRRAAERALFEGRSWRIVAEFVRGSVSSHTPPTSFTPQRSRP